MTQKQKVLHALNRLTFGPRPGDVAEVTKVGLNAWFEQQLHPERIADTSLSERLAQFPAMELSQSQLVEEFPSPQRLRQYSKGALSAPDTRLERAIYADASLGYQQKVMAAETLQGSPVRATEVQGSSSRTPSGTTPAGMQAQGATAGVRPTDAAAGDGQQKMSPPMSAAAVQAIVELPPVARLQRLIALSPTEMQSLRGMLRGNQQERLYIGLAPAEVEQVAAMQSPERVVDAEVMATRLLRDVYSQRQLQAVMTDFWLNHFNVYAKKDQNEPYLLPAYERETILPHALGRFEDLLRATAQSPAMLVYLDNSTSIGPDSRAAGRTGRAVGQGQGASSATGAKASGKPPKGINENYARELMELHTLGVGGGYTQQDVIEVAKCFTGWTIERPDDGSGFVFNPNRHEPGPKTVLGHSIPEGGEDEGLAVLHLLATSPSTAHLLSFQLAQRFVSDVPPRALVDRMTAAYLHSDGNIAAVLSAMFHSPEFWSVATYRAKVKTPLEFLVSALRASNAEITDARPLIAALTRLGMPLYGMQTPNGYSWLATDWVSSTGLLTRMNLALVLAGDRLHGTRLDWASLLSGAGGAAETPDPATEHRLEWVILGGNAAPHTRAAVLEQAMDPTAQRTAEQGLASVRSETDSDMAAAGKSPWRQIGTNPSRDTNRPEMPLDTMAGLLLGSPDFQRR